MTWRHQRCGGDWTPSPGAKEIVEAVLDVLAHRDVNQISMKDIAQQAGSSPALIHHYFGTKLALAEAALAMAADRLSARLDLVQDAQIEQYLNATLATYLDFLEERPVW